MREAFGQKIIRDRHKLLPERFASTGRFVCIHNIEQLSTPINEPQQFSFWRSQNGIGDREASEK